MSTSTTTAASQPTYHILHYSYVPNMSTRRTPIRPQPLQHTTSYVQAGHLILGGAIVPDIREGTLIFKGLGREGVEEFARRDPYVVNGLVEEWTVKEWTVVVGSAM